MSTRRAKTAIPGSQVLSAGMLVMVAAASLWAADTRKEFKYTITPGSNVTVSNAFGEIVVRPVSGRQVTITATTHSDKVAIDSAQLGNRVHATTNFLQNVDPKSTEGQVNYEVMVPYDCNVVIQNGNGVLKLSGVRSDISLKADQGQVEVSDVNNSHVHVQTVEAPVTLTNVRSQHVEVVSNGGDVQLTKVTGHEVSVNTDTGNINYDGDFAGSGRYSLMNHTGNINVTLPATASVDLTARSMQGTVQNDFPFQPKISTSPVPLHGSSFLGTFQGTPKSIFSQVDVSSFSGTIRVKKR